MNRPETFKDLYDHLSDLRAEKREKNRAEQRDYALGYLLEAFTRNSFKKIIISETTWREKFEDLMVEICAAGFIVSKEEDTENPGEYWYSISLQ